MDNINVITIEVLEEIGSEYCAYELRGVTTDITTLAQEMLKAIEASWKTRRFYDEVKLTLWKNGERIVIEKLDCEDSHDFDYENRKSVFYPEKILNHPGLAMFRNYI